jgi:hypothetical protein
MAVSKESEALHPLFKQLIKTTVAALAAVAAAASSASV